MAELNIPRIGTADQTHGRPRTLRRLNKSILALLLRIPLLRWAQSRALILRSLVYRIRELCSAPAGWSMEFSPSLVEEIGYKWMPACTEDTLQPLDNIPWTDHLDLEIAAQAWLRGAEWGYRNACRRSGK